MNNAPTTPSQEGGLAGINTEQEQTIQEGEEKLDDDVPDLRGISRRLKDEKCREAWRREGQRFVQERAQQHWARQ